MGIKHTSREKDLISSTPRRFSPQQQQEQLSIGQVKICFAGWSINSLFHDLGEDMLVQIYDDGRSTGLSFLMQLKSTQSLDKLMKKRSPQFAKYSIEIKDLQHWMDSIPPVVLIVWDVNQSRGLWQDIPSIIAALDKGTPHWRKRKKGEITVELPVSNTTDVSGHAALRTRIAVLGFPQLSQDKELTISPTFKFPRTPEGLLAAVVLRKATEEGEAITIGGEYIQSVRFSPWWERAFGQQTFTVMSLVPAQPNRTLRIGFRAITPDRTETIYSELECRKAGLGQATLSTTDEREPLQASVVIDRSGARVNLSIKRARTVGSALSLARFLMALHESQKLFMVMPGEHIIGPVKVSTHSLISDVSKLRVWEELLQKLSFIQSRIARFGTIDLTPGIRQSDVLDIEMIVSICNGLSWKIKGDIRISLPPGTQEVDASAEAPKMLSLKFDSFGEAKCMNVQVPLGHAQAEVTLPEGFSTTYKQALGSGTPFLDLTDVEATVQFRDWAPPNDGP